MLTLAVSLLLTLSPQVPEVGTRAGQLYPDIELPVVSGTGSGAETLRFSSLRGKRILLIEFASW